MQFTLSFSLSFKPSEAICLVTKHSIMLQEILDYFDTLRLPKHTHTNTHTRIYIYIYIYIEIERERVTIVIKIQHKKNNPINPMENITKIEVKVKMATVVEGDQKTPIFNSYYTEVSGIALLISLVCPTLPLIHTLYCWVLSKDISSTIF